MKDLRKERLQRIYQGIQAVLGCHPLRTCETCGSEEDKESEY